MRKLILFLGTFFALSGVASAAPVKISGNAIYSWWIHPLAQQVGSDVYFTGVTQDGTWRVFKNNSTEAYVSLDNDGPGDDHNAPSILMKPGKDAIAFYSRHGTQNYVSYRKAPEGTLGFGARQYVNFPSSVAYSQILSYGDKLVLFTRTGQKWSYSVSEDYGGTWGASAYFYESVSGRVYINFEKSETTAGLYHFAVAYNPDNLNPHYITYGTLDLTTGDVSKHTGVVANIYDHTGTLPFRKQHIDDLGVIQNDDQHVRLLDVGDKHGKTVVYYAKWDGGITSRYYQAVQNSDGTWTRTSLGITTGRCFTPTEEAKHYIGGVALNRNDADYLYASYEAGGTWYIKKYPINSDMTLGTATTIASDSTYPLVRPYPIRGADKVIYQRLKSYTTFKQYSSELWEE